MSELERPTRKTGAQRMAEYAKRRREAGYKNVRILFSPGEHKAAVELAKRRGVSVPGAAEAKDQLRRKEQPKSITL